MIVAKLVISLMCVIPGAAACSATCGVYTVHQHACHVCLPVGAESQGVCNLVCARVGAARAAQGGRAGVFKLLLLRLTKRGVAALVFVLLS